MEEEARPVVVEEDSAPGSTSNKGQQQKINGDMDDVRWTEDVLLPPDKDDDVGGDGDVGVLRRRGARAAAAAGKEGEGDERVVTTSPGAAEEDKDATSDAAPEAAGSREEAAATGEPKQCKICLGGEEEEGELGRLISPCKCKGTIKYVHIECLNQWRKASQNPQSYYQCDNCKYKYNIQRTKLSSYLRSRWVLHTLTLITLLVIVWVSGAVWKVIDYTITPEEELDWASWWVPDLQHILSGLVLVGMAGFMQMMTIVVRGPLPFLGRGGGGNDGVGAVIFGVVVIIGLLRATVAIYKLVESLTRRALEKADDLVVEVN